MCQFRLGLPSGVATINTLGLLKKQNEGRGFSPLLDETVFPAVTPLALVG